MLYTAAIKYGESYDVRSVKFDNPLDAMLEALQMAKDLGELERRAVVLVEEPYRHELSLEAIRSIVADHNELVRAFKVVMDNVDFTRHACSPTNMVGACLDSRVLDQANRILDKYRKRK